MIRIERPEFRGQCTCCFGNDAVKEIHFVSKSGGYNESVVCLCSKCREELKEELERHDS